MEDNTNRAQRKLEENLYEQKRARKNRNITLGVIAILCLATYFIVPKILKNFETKEIECLKTQTAIYEKYKDAVVLVKHTYSYEVSIKGSEPFTLEVEDTGGETITGTGFFVSQDGKIVTNHHVAEPWLYDNNNSASENYLKNNIASILPDSIAPTLYKQYLTEHWYEGGEEDNYEETELVASETVPTIITDTNAIPPTEVPEPEAVIAKKDIKYVAFEDVVITFKTIEINIALHGSNNEWLACQVLKVSDNKEVDVAVLQLKSQKLPTNVTNIIDFENAIIDEENIKPGSNAILIGYPMGMELANTRKGIKVQVYEGQINKESDGVSLQYNVTSTHGASGSPVFNECGQLIAVNYAGYDQAQGYNFGIVAKHAQNLMN